MFKIVRMKKQLLTLFTVLLGASITSHAQIISEINASSGQVEIYNDQLGAVDVSTYYLCNFPDYSQISDLNIVCGSYLIEVGEYLVVDGFPLVAADGELGLYTEPNYGSSAAIISYVEWGTTGHFRSSTAVGAGIWQTGWFVESPLIANWIALDGLGTSVDNWIYVTEATLCGPNVVVAECDGGMVSTTDEATSVSLCSMDENADLVPFFTTSESTENYQYIITDEDNVILGLPGDSNDFNDAPAGVCRVWGLSYDGMLTLEVGDDMDDVVPTDECWDMSDNFIQVTRTVVDAGDVTLEDGSTLAYACFGDDETIYTFDNNSTAEANYVYVVVENNIILEVIVGDSNNFGFMAEATCSIYGISYTGDFLLSNGMNLFDTPASDGCFDITDSPATVITHSPEGGMIAANGMDTTYACIGQPVEFSTTSESNLIYTYAITNLDNELLAIADNGSFDFAGMDLGSYLVYGLSYANELLLVNNEDIFANDAANQCFSWSDSPATVVLQDADGGMVATTDDEDTVEFCSMDEGEDIVMFASTSVATSDYIYVITDPDGNLLGIAIGSSHDFNDAPAGTCYVYGYAYTGNLTIALDENIFDTPISDGCGELSGNFITIIRHVVDGGAVATADQETSVTVFLDGTSDVISFQSDSESEEDYTYIITDDSENILAVLDGNSNDFESGEVGECHVYGVSHWGDLTAVVGTSINDVSATGCLDLSSNFVTVIKDVFEYVSSHSANDFSVYPNPAADFITLSAGDFQGATWNILDQTGRVVQSGKVQAANQIISVDNLSTGAYTLQVLHDDQLSAKTLLID